MFLFIAGLAEIQKGFQYHNTFKKKNFLIKNPRGSFFIYIKMLIEKCFLFSFVLQAKLS
jgi:hypothetical protein